MTEAPAAHYARLRRAIGEAPLPLGLVDLDALEANVDTLVAPVRAGGKTLRIATKSLRCPTLLRLIAARGGDTVRGLMTYAAAETAWLAREGFRDLLLAYPTVQPHDLQLIAETNAAGAVASIAVDDEAQLAAADRAARAAGTTIPVILDVDLSYRPLGGRVHLGVRRSPLLTTDDAVALALRIAAYPGLRFHGVLGYEAQIAGLPDDSPTAAWMNPIKRAIKRRSVPDVVARRQALVTALGARGLAPTLVNGGGTGSVGTTPREAAVTEVTAGSGFVDSHLFDHYRGLPLRPAAAFALQIVRRPGPGMVTCLGGGWIASGQAGPDRLPRPWLPEGLALLPVEGAGEVQTPLTHPPDLSLALGDPVFFRHAKAGELAEHLDEYLLVRGDRVVERAPTYRGRGLCFLG